MSVLARQRSYSATQPPAFGAQSHILFRHREKFITEELPELISKSDLPIVGSARLSFAKA